MRSFLRKVILLVVGFCVVSLVAFAQSAPPLGVLYDFNALASLKVKNEGGTVVNASVGASDGPVQGFPPGEIKREKHERDAYARRAIADARTAESFLASQVPTTTLSNGNLDGKTLTPGVYRINGDASINGTLTFNGQGQENPVFIIQVTGKLNITRAQYEMLNGAASMNLYWVVEGEVTVSKGGSAIGNIFSESNITLADGAQLQGRLVATQSEISLTNNVLNFPADLEISLSKTPGSKAANTYDFGQTITYTITVKNNGPVNENGVVVAGIQYIGELLSYTSSVPNAAFEGSTWTIGTLNYKQTATLSITARLNVAGSGYIRAMVYGYGIDEIRSNNTADMNFCVLLSETGVISGPAQVCINESYIYSIAPVEGATRYTWSVPSGWSYTMLGPTSIRVTAGTNGGFIKVTASNTCGEGPARAFEVTTQNAAPAKPGPISGPNALCESGEQLKYSINPIINATNYAWTVPSGWAIASGQGTTEITVNTDGTSGQVTVQASNSCGAGPAQVLNVTIYDAVPVAPASILGTAQGCVGATTTYEVDAVAGAGVNGYKWTVPAGWVITAGQGTNRITVRVGASSGNIGLQVENLCGISPAVTLPVEPVTSIPVALGPIAGLPITCSAEKGIVYTVVPVPTVLNYDWNVPAGWVITAGQGTNEITVNAGSNGGEVSVAAINDCGASARSVLNVASTPNAPAIPGAITGAVFGCISSTGAYSIASVSGATSYIWTVPSGWSITSGQGSTSIEVTIGTGSGKITVKAVSACGTSPAKELTVTPVSTAPVGLTLSDGNNSVCVGATVTFEARNDVNVGSYIWEVPAGWAVVSGQGTAQVTVKVGATGGAVQLTALNGCGELKVSKEVTVSALPPAVPGAITGTLATCQNSTQTYSISGVNGAVSYTWAVPAGWVILKGQGTTSIEVKAGSGTGNITVAAVNGCGNSNQRLLAVESATGVPAAIGAIKAPQSSFCQGTANLSYSIATVANATSYIWEVPAGWTITSGQGTTSIKVTAGTAAGQVKVTASNACGAGSTKAIEVAPQVQPVAPQLIAGPQNPCTGVATIYSVVSTAGIDAYQWEVPAGWVILSGQGTATIEVKATSTASGKVKVTARNSCGGSDATELAVTPSAGVPATPGVIEGSASACVGRSSIYKVASASSTATYTWSVPTGWSITAGQGTGEITVIAGNSAGAVTVAASSSCGSSQSTSMQVAPAPLAEPGMIIDRSTPCEGLVYELAAVDGANTYIWEVPAGWTITSGQGTTKITVTPGEGTGYITVAASNGSCNSEPVSLVPNKELAKTELSFPNVFSPNNDGNNDTWAIRNLQHYPNNELTILNRWGNEVYNAKSYKNNWDGDNLSEGTYFYVARVKMCDGGEKVFKGFVTIVR
jgi:gliding motility-associated-like protein